ncbi:hypothetical protein RIF29_19006 [Crotalaria pallida]|uniref:Uncharacterized protein n=1 Tax=Crotalaria pallida TaxID=3830 RepID=A0AAN9I546_CROPI
MLLPSILWSDTASLSESHFNSYGYNRASVNAVIPSLLIAFSAFLSFARKEIVYKASMFSEKENEKYTVCIEQHWLCKRDTD